MKYTEYLYTYQAKHNRVHSLVSAEKHHYEKWPACILLCRYSRYYRLYYYRQSINSLIIENHAAALPHVTSSLRSLKTASSYGNLALYFTLLIIYYYYHHCILLTLLIFLKLLLLFRCCGCHDFCCSSTRCGFRFCCPTIGSGITIINNNN